MYQRRHAEDAIISLKTKIEVLLMTSEFFMYNQFSSEVIWPNSLSVVNWRRDTSRMLLNLFLVGCEFLILRRSSICLHEQWLVESTSPAEVESRKSGDLPLPLMIPGNLSLQSR